MCLFWRSWSFLTSSLQMIPWPVNLSQRMVWLRICLMPGVMTCHFQAARRTCGPRTGVDMTWWSMTWHDMTSNFGDKKGAIPYQLVNWVWRQVKISANGTRTGTLQMGLQLWFCFVLFLTGRVSFFSLLPNMLFRVLCKETKPWRNMNQLMKLGKFH